MFRKRSTHGPILRLVIGVLVVIGLLWLIPWQVLSSVDVGEEPKVETVEALRVIQAVEAPEVVEASKDQPEQKTTEEDQPKAATPPPAQPPSSSPPRPAPPAAPRVEEVPQNFLPPPNDYYWDYGPWDYGPDYWGYEPDSDYYWSY